MSVRERFRDALSTSGSAWQRFWFDPVPMTTLGIVRIAYGLLVIGWTFSLLPELDVLFGDDGLQPNRFSIDYSWTILSLFDTDAAVLWLWIALLVASVLLTIGWHSRIAAVVVFICVISFERQNIFVFNSGDVLIRLEALFLALAPCGAALSLDRKRTAGSFWSAQSRAPYGLRVMQLQLSLVYIVTVHDKLTGTTWNDGSAVSYSLRQSDLANFAAPSWLTMNATLMNLATWGALGIELAIGVLVWNRRLRPWVLAAGVVLHLSILLGLAVAFFSFAMFILYLSFIPPETSAAWFETPEARARIAARLMPWRRGKTKPVPEPEPEPLPEPEYEDTYVVEQNYYDDDLEPETAPIPTGRAARRRQLEREQQERSYQGGHHRGD